MTERRKRDKQRQMEDNRARVAEPSASEEPTTSEAHKSECGGGVALRWRAPSAGDLIFLSLLFLLTAGPWASSLLDDAGTGWHIRTGEQILQTLSVPRADPFSYTGGGQPWFAWEWLYDALLGAVHTRLGLNGVVLLTALVIASTFFLLYRLALRASGDAPIAAALTLLAVFGSSIHFLARPHVVSWLFTVIWMALLERHRRGERKALLWLPALMLLWVNLHGGFVLGVVLPGLYLAAELWTLAGTRAAGGADGAARRTRDLAAATTATLAATLANPYGLGLHAHIYGYLTNSFFMDRIGEFLSPNFHRSGDRFFELLLLVVVAALALSRERLRAQELLVTLFAVHAALYAARNIPVASILLVAIMAPRVSNCLKEWSEEPGPARWLGGRPAAWRGITERVSRRELQKKIPVWPAAGVAVLLWAALHGGEIGSRKLLEARFRPQRLPVEAAEWLAAEGVRQGVFSRDDWGGYLIYRLHPEFKVFVDDRHDFYGERFVADHLEVLRVGPRWKEVLQRHGVNWVLAPPDSALAGALRESAGWRVAHADRTAAVFARVMDAGATQTSTSGR